jgi:hypothetical protein
LPPGMKFFSSLQVSCSLHHKNILFGHSWWLLKICHEAHQSSAIHWKTSKTQNWFHITTAFQSLSYSSENCQNSELDFSQQQQPSPFSKSQLPQNSSKRDNRKVLQPRPRKN